MREYINIRVYIGLGYEMFGIEQITKIVYMVKCVI